ncbi:neural cell adhesion molecule 2 [Drosophila tropicalis]|uniref:neural cell adhesion molecule 2 n=1 Tax=Drosophila tropicalis TaxID=46794 RepID=UPI0035AB8E7E
MIKMRDTTCLWLICLLIGQFYAQSQASPVESDNGNQEEYQDDDYDYGDEDDAGTDAIPSIEPASIDPPYFEQEYVSLRAKPGDNVVINCDVRNFQLSNAVMWYKNQTIIANGQIAISNRVEGMKNNSILIKNVTPEDADDYYCLVLPDQIRQHTSLMVGARLSILCDGLDITDRSQTFKQGDHHKLECRTYMATSTNIKWSLNGHRLESSDSENGVIMLDNIDESNVGVYQCLGDDGSRDPPHGMVTIDVHYSPKVSTHRHHVNAIEGGHAELYCNYRANPIALSFFIKGAQTLQISEKYSIKNSFHEGHNRTTLLVKNIEASDLGEYLCHAENAIGSNEVKIQLSYNPETPQFEDMTIDGNKVTLHWLVRSLQPLSEAMLDYQLTGSYTWSTVTVLKTQHHNQTGGIWKITHQMELKPGLWHAHVKTKNTHGWSNFSPDHEFQIKSDDADSSIDDVDMPPPDDLVRAGFGVGNVATTLVQLPGITLLSVLLLRLQL